MTVLPGSVVAAHLHACASGLADGTVPARARSCVETPRELAEVIDHLVAGQRQIAASLAQLADYVHDRRLDRALSEVLMASAEAAGFSADALAESQPLVQVVQDVTGPDTRL
jgi:ATP-dependent protease Clp ATPase subunit